MRYSIVLYLLLAGCCEYRLKASYHTLIAGAEIEVIVKPGGMADDHVRNQSN